MTGQDAPTMRCACDECVRLRLLGDAVVRVIDDLDISGFVSQASQERLRQAARDAWIDLP